MGVFFDIKKTFDYVNHQLLLKNLNYSRIRDIIVNYLSHF